MNFSCLYGEFIGRQYTIQFNLLFIYLLSSAASDLLQRQHDYKQHQYDYIEQK
jgi:hypothetical protein